MAQKFPTLDSRSFSPGTQLDSAVFFASKGIPIVPLHGTIGGVCTCYQGANCKSPGKHPTTEHGLKDASADLDTIEDWFEQSPNANLGLLTGADTGLVVLDVDPRHGGDRSLIELQKEFGPLPKTIRVKTGGDGEHYYFQHPGGKVGNKTGIRDGLDLRGDGGYIVAPPSIHASTRPYLWDEEADTIAPLPSWLLDLINTKKKTILPKAADNNSSLAEGKRNASLMSIGGTLKSRGLDQSQIATALSALNQVLCHPPLEASEVAQITQSLSKYQEATWQEPMPLPPEARAMKLDRSMLPEPLGAWCADISERMQVPLECVAGSAIAMLSSLIGRKIAIYPKRHDRWVVIGNLWAMIVAPPGSLKTPTFNEVLRLLFGLDDRSIQKFEEESQKLKELETVAKTEIDALKDALKKAVRDGKPDRIEQCKNLLALAVRDLEEKSKITARRYIVNDSTTEMLLTIIRNNPQGIMLYRDELSGWLESMHKSGREGDRQFYLESWAGDASYKTDRISRGTTAVPGLCLSVLGGLQPIVLESYVAAMAKGGKSDDGFLQRFQLLIYPERQKGWKNIDREPDPVAEAAIARIVEAFDGIPVPKQTDDGVERLRLGYDDEAQELANQWMEELQQRLEDPSLSHLFETHLSKYKSLMPSLAALFCLIRAFGSDEGVVPETIDGDSVKLAIDWCHFLESHAKKAYGEHLEPTKSAARNLLKKIKKKQIKDFDRPRDLYRKRWKGLSTSDEMDSALEMLEKLGWLRVEAINSDGKAIDVIRLHPSLRMI